MVHVITDNCVACGTCIDECPVDVISESGIYSTDADTCIDCGTRTAACPSGVIEG